MVSSGLKNLILLLRALNHCVVSAFVVGIVESYRVYGWHAVCITFILEGFNLPL